MERRSFFRTLLGTAVAGATVAAAKTTGGELSGRAIVPRETAQVESYAGFKCAECGSAMWNSRNGTMRCYAEGCKNRDRPLRMPLFTVEVADSDEEELLRHSFIIMGLVLPGQRVSAADMELGSEVIRRYLEKANRDRDQEASPYGTHAPTTIHDIAPHWLAMELQPYYQIS